MLDGVCREAAGVETGFVPPLAEGDAGIVVRMIAELVSSVRVDADMLAVIFHLKQPVVPKHPSAFCPNIGCQDRGRDRIVVHRCQHVAEVMEQGRHHPIDVRAIAFCPRRRLQRMVEPRDLIPSGRMIQHRKMFKNAIGQPGLETFFLAMQQVVICLGTFAHTGERDGFHQRSLGWGVSVLQRQRV